MISDLVSINVKWTNLSNQLESGISDPKNTYSGSYKRSLTTIKIDDMLHKLQKNIDVSITKNENENSVVIKQP